jgi:hypothetical protein
MTGLARTQAGTTKSAVSKHQQSESGARRPPRQVLPDRRLMIVAVVLAV